jgi:hypothetical protein
MIADDQSRIASSRDGNGLLRPWLWASLVLMVFALPALVRAQFQQPTDEELKMTADPKAPGAAAVYLYREEITDNINKYSSLYVRIKVLADKGKELATVHVPYERVTHRVTGIQGRTIHADGTVIPLTIKPVELLNVKTKDVEEDSIVFNLPSVEVGSILEYRYRIENYYFEPDAATWWVQQPYYVRKAHYSFHAFTFRALQPPFYTLYQAFIGSDAKLVEKSGVYSLDLINIPPQPDDDWMPPINTLRWHVEFYYSIDKYDQYGKPAQDIKEFWDDACKRWALKVKDSTNPSGYLKKEVAKIIAPGDTDLQKATKIYDAIQKLDNTDFSRQKSKTERKKEKLKDINKVEDIWKQKSGSGDDIALLYVALARAAGLKVWPMQVVNRDHALFDKGYMSLRQLEDFIVIVAIDGKDVFLDPGQKMCPFGILHWKHTFAAGLRLAETDAVIITTPIITFKESVIQRTADLTIDEAGSVKGSVRVNMTGPEALRWRQLALENDETEVRKQFIESLQDSLPEGVRADFDHFIALDDYNSNLVGLINISGNIGTTTGKHFFLPGLFFESRAKHPFVAQDKRTTPIDVHFPRMDQDVVTYQLPPGFAVEGLPQDSSSTWPGNALFKIHFSKGNGTVTVRRSMAYNYTLLDPKDYNDLRDFYLKLSTADQLQLVLTRASESKGN